MQIIMRIVCCKYQIYNRMNAITCSDDEEPMFVYKVFFNRQHFKQGVFDLRLLIYVTAVIFTSVSIRSAQDFHQRIIQ